MHDQGVRNDKFGQMWFTKKKHSANTVAVIQAAFPTALHDDVAVALDHVGVAEIEPHQESSYRATVGSSTVTIPYRVYFPRASGSDIEDLTQTQKGLFAAFMTRHHDGFQRELWVRTLCSHPADWSVPFLAFLLGDYVIEVLRVVEQGLTPEWRTLFEEFSAVNRIERRPLNHRIINYWNLYYRRRFHCKSLIDYPGYTVALTLGLWDPKTAPKLMKKGKRQA